MKTKIKLESILDQYIIVVDGDEKKVVYDIDYNTNECGSGARNALLSKKTFKTLKEAENGIKHLNHKEFEFKVIKVFELKDLSEKGWNDLIKNIEDFNLSVDFEKEMEIKSKKEENERFLELKTKELELKGISKDNIVFEIKKHKTRLSEISDQILLVSGAGGYKSPEQIKVISKYIRNLLFDYKEISKLLAHLENANEDM